MDYERIMEVFKDYLERDEVELLKTSRGYALVIWDSLASRYGMVEHIDSPERMLEVIIEDYKITEILKLTHGKREENKKDVQIVQMKCEEKVKACLEYKSTVE